MATFAVPPVRLPPAPLPITVLLEPLVSCLAAEAPTATLSNPPARTESASNPTPTFLAADPLPASLPRNTLELLVPGPVSQRKRSLLEPAVIRALVPRRLSSVRDTDPALKLPLPSRWTRAPGVFRGVP